MSKKKVYIVVGSNNFWYAQCDTKKEAQQVIKDILDGGGYSNPENDEAPEIPQERIYIFEAYEVHRHEVEDDAEVCDYCGTREGSKEHCDPNNPKLLHSWETGHN